MADMKNFLTLAPVVVFLLHLYQRRRDSFLFLSVRDILIEFKVGTTSSVRLDRLGAKNIRFFHVPPGLV